MEKWKQTGHKAKFGFFASIVLVMMLAFSSIAMAATYTDIDGHWAQDQITKWSDAGLVQGADGKFRPADSITRGEMAVILDRVMAYQVKASNSFTDLGQQFYTDAILKANAAGVIKGDGATVRPNDKITRQEAAVMLGRAFGVDESSSALSFNDSAKVASWAKGYVAAMNAAGYVQGNAGNFNPTANITRAETVKIIDNMVAKFVNKADTYTGDVTGNVVVNVKDVILKDMTISGNLILADGIAEGDVTLENVVVKGKTIIRGGGVNSIKVTGKSDLGTVVVVKLDGGKVRIAVSGDAKVATVDVVEAGEVIITGAVTNVTLSGEGVKVTAADAEISKVTIAGEAAALTVDKDSTVKTVAMNGATNSLHVEGKVTDVTVAGKNAIVGGDGKITNVKVNADGAKVDAAGAKVDVAKDVTATVNGKKVNDTTTTTPDSNTGSGGGGGNHSSSNLKKQTVIVPPNKEFDYKTAYEAAGFTFDGKTISVKDFNAEKIVDKMFGEGVEGIAYYWLQFTKPANATRVYVSLDDNKFIKDAADADEDNFIEEILPENELIYGFAIAAQAGPEKEWMLVQDGEWDIYFKWVDKDGKELAITRATIINDTGLDVEGATIEWDTNKTGVTEGKAVPTVTGNTISFTGEIPFLTRGENIPESGNYVGVRVNTPKGVTAEEAYLMGTLVAEDATYNVSDVCKVVDDAQNGTSYIQFCPMITGSKAKSVEFSVVWAGYEAVYAPQTYKIDWSDATLVAGVSDPVIEVTEPTGLKTVDEAIKTGENGSVAADEFDTEGITPFDVTLKLDDEYPEGVKARVLVEVTGGENDGLQLFAQDTADTENKQPWYDVAKVGWGPTEGADLLAFKDAVVKVYPVANKAGEYTVTLKLVDIANKNKELATKEFKVTAVTDPKIELEDVSGKLVATKLAEEVAGGPSGLIDSEKFKTEGVPFMTSTLTKGSEDYTVAIEMEVTSNNKGHIQIIAQDSDKLYWDILKSGWGTPNGFAMPDTSNATFYIIADQAGTYNGVIKLMNYADPKAPTLILEQEVEITVEAAPTTE